MLGINHTTPIGKLALVLAMSEGEEEEKRIKEFIHTIDHTTGAATFITGMSNKITASYAKIIVNTALSSGVIAKHPGQVHAVIHASLEALHAMISLPSVSTSLKVKIGMVSNKKWVAIAAYGYSAFSVYTNHERCGLGMMHL
ncbi:Hut operon positive regulatory protein [Saezia sanguinis]|uniref:Hut operon positive regulatory protein n=1 Tax=Saezia sanguinis TaxID=1965230 RepID=A0A433SHD8_9BURK|nr:HutP family protein [Saezia sanguinis]RUS68126.1 Hut operon positive regulatory protein [Saezia sanguinis]